MTGAITDVGGVLVGHDHDLVRGSGVTVLLFPGGAAGAVDIRGEAAGTRQMDSLLRPHPAGRIQGLVFAGGSAYGLDAASGVLRYLEERGKGFPTPAGVVPIVPTAVLYDLGYGDSSFRPTPEMGYAAAVRASSGPVGRGSVGAGAGATVGKAFGIGRAMKGGFGTACEEGPGCRVGACAVVNAFGDVVDPDTGKRIAGARDAGGGNGPASTEDAFRGGLAREPFAPGNTTLAVVATEEILARDELATVARMAQSALCRAIRPVHTPMDGDLVIAISTGTGRKGNVMQAAVLATRALERAIVDGVRSARGNASVPAASELTEGGIRRG